jgi:plastocyanin
MRIRAITPVVFLALALALAACGPSSTAGGSPTATTGPATATATAAPTATPTTSGGVGGSATISMAARSFSGNTSVTIKAGQAVTFDDPASGGGVHNLVTGQGGTFTAVSGAPSEFASANGQSFSPGDRKTVVFANPGTFPITCTIHASMQATITVTQ